MIRYKFSGSTSIRDQGIRKHFRNIEAWQPIIEFVWNGFDANATEVAVRVDFNEAHGLDHVSILDNGDGIDFLDTDENFGKFNESSKVSRVSLHGSHGRGRLAFHKLCNEARWYTRTSHGDAVLVVESSDLAHYEVNGLSSSEQHALVAQMSTGTCVELVNFKNNLPSVDIISRYLSVEFGWYLALNKGRRLFLNGVMIQVPSHEISEIQVDVDGHAFNIKLIRWEDKPSSEKSFTYLMTPRGNTVFKALSSLNNKPNFFTSVYVVSSWAEAFDVDDEELLVSSFDPNCKAWRLLSRELTQFTQSVYDEFLKRFVDDQLDKFSEDGIFPEYPGISPEDAQWRGKAVRQTVKSIYLADPSIFNTLQKKQKKILIRLLDRLMVSNENDSLFEVLESTLDLDGASIKTLANQLKSIKLENIISTIEVLNKRQVAVHQLRDLMNNHYLELRETPDLQQIIESNTWLFGPAYETLGAEEDEFTQVARNLRDAVKGVGNISEDDLDEAEASSLEISKRQPDLFLARKIPCMDSYGQEYYRCIVVEIKRPSISLNVKHLRQLDDYAAIIKKFPQYTSTKMQFELILIGRKISHQDTEIESRLRTHVGKGDMGLVSDDPRMRRYIKNWYTILDEFELKNKFMLEKLRVQRNALEISTKEDLVGALREVAVTD